jgi:hypothetical protein
MRQLLAILATATAAVGIVAATMTATTPDSPATTRGVADTASYMLPYEEQDNIYRSVSVSVSL